MYFQTPLVLLLLIPAVIAAVYFFKKAVGKKQRLLIGTRGIIAILLIIALANPISFMTVTKTDTNPNLILISDETDSMRYFSSGAGSDLYEFFSERFQVKYDILRGNYTAIGEKIIQYADGRNQILLVTDGNSNYGATLKEAIDFALQTNTTVSAVVPALTRNDLSVEIIGDKSVIIGNDQEFGITVRQAGNATVTYSFEVAIDGQIVQRGTETMNTSEKTTPFTTKFSSLGAHNLTVTITSSADTDPINNRFTKSVYVIEKPNVIVVTSERDSSLMQILGTMYNVTVVTSLSEFSNLNQALSNTKTVVMDNVFIGNLSESQVDSLKTYVSNGGGLVVVGGSSSYGYPEGNSYLNTSFEKLLPVVSIPSDWEGIQDVYLFIDVSDSTSAFGDNREPIVSNIKATAINIIESDYFHQANMTYLTIGDSAREVSGEFFYVGNPREAEKLKDEIDKLQTGDGRTDLKDTFEKAVELMENRSGQPLIIILSDGNLVAQNTYAQLLDAENSVYKYGSTIVFMNIYTHASIRPEQFRDSNGNIYAQRLVREYRGQGVYVESPQGRPLNPDFSQLLGSSDKPDDTTKASLYISNPRHFIVQGIDITNTSISGYNSVTPKAGSDKLVIASDGSPVLTVWRYGLGRVASLTTDNGVGRSNYWAPELYAAPGSKLVSATMNWVIGDPNKESGIVIDCPDTYVGLPVTLRVYMYDGSVPNLMFNGSRLILTLESENIYTAELVFNQTGTFNVSGYPITVNYPVEYRDIGVNSELRSLIESTGGYIYSVSDAKAFYIKNNGDKVTYKTREPISFNVYLLLFALLIFLGEIIYRRIMEIKDLRRLHEEYDRMEREGQRPSRPPDRSASQRQNDMVADAKKDAGRFFSKVKSKVKKEK
ncbi:MAG: hypothetical protein FWH46_02585 [Methanimicrococcus sp.]|nr:hypothetical protein [Methanimicrococcus sp.]